MRMPINGGEDEDYVELYNDMYNVEDNFHQTLHGG